jgi:hypothetical protein
LEDFGKTQVPQVRKWRMGFENAFADFEGSTGLE